MQLKSYALFFLFMGGFLAHASLESSPELVKSILEKYIEFEGGRKVMLQLKTLEAVGDLELEGQGMEVKLHQRVQSPDKLNFIQEYPVLGVIRSVLCGNQGWEFHPIAGDRPLDPEEIRDISKDTNLQRDLFLLDEFRDICLGSPEEIDGVETVHLILTPETGEPEHWYFKSTGELVQKIHWVASGPESAYESTERFYDYALVDGVRLPHTIRFIHPTHSATLRISRYLLNQEMDPELFQWPARE